MNVVSEIAVLNGAARTIVEMTALSRSAPVSHEELPYLQE